MKRWLLMLLTALGLCGIAAAQTGAPAGRVLLVEIKGAIGIATTLQVEAALQQAAAEKASLVVLRLDTPGGLVSATRDLIQVMLASDVPIAVYIAPAGARAASAGTYILYACHVAAMAPATNLGAATPVPVGGSAPLPGMPDKPEGGKGEKGDKDEMDKDAAPGQPPRDAMQAKVVNDAVAYIRSLAEKRGRNADWAERAVREGVSLSADRALEQRVIDLVASDVDELLAKIDGRVVVTTAGELTLRTAGLAVEAIEPDWRMKFLAVITNPTVAYILLLIGIYGLLLEGYHPGAILPGVTGAICLLLALFAFQVLPVNYVGLALVLLGVVLMIAEAFAPSFGVLGVGGLVAFVFGSIMLMDIDVPGYGVNRGIIFGIAAGGAAVLAGTLYLLWRARQAPVTTGDRTLVGHTLEVLQANGPEGWGWVAGERWKFRGSAPAVVGQRLRVTGIDGLTLVVEPEQK
jgi:membrane-bound serine protease (ClpP class)